MKKIVCICYLLLCGIIAFGQKCPDSLLYKTDSLGGEFRMYFPLDFVIKKDSVIMYIRNHHTRSFATFQILGKKCFIAPDNETDSSQYRLRLIDGDYIDHATMKIHFVATKPSYIELLYDNKEPRFFIIRKE